MGEIKISWPDSCKRDYKVVGNFFQKLANRLVVGHFRYGSPKVEQKYLTRLIMEIKAYKKTGNYENLLNIANYCWLESQAPENKKFHHDASVDSATRKKMGGNIR